MKKQFVSILAAITILCNLCFTEVYAFEDSTSALKEFTLTENTTFFKSSHSTVAQDDSENYANISIDSAGQVASITFSIDEHVYTVNMTGMLDAISSGTNTGYVGVFEGTFDPDSNDPTFAPLSKSDLPIIADIVFTGNESFCALTFGDASENKNPIIYHFGIYSDSIRNISKAYIVSLENDNIAIAAKSTSRATVDAEMRVQDYAAIKSGTYSLGEVSIFHANQLRNQNTMTVAAKVNSDKDNAVSYINTSLGYPASKYTVVAYPDTAYISIQGNHSNFHAASGSITPDNNETRVSLPIYFYAGEFLGIQSVSLSLVTSKTSVTTSPYGSNSPHDDNKVSWEVYRQGGFNADGSYEDKTGIGVKASYQFEGTVQNSMYTSLTTTGKLRYTYVVEEKSSSGNTDAFVYHFTTASKSLYTDVEILP